MPSWSVCAIAAGLLAATAVAAYAASNMNVKKDETFQISVPAALLLDPESDSVLFEKNGDQLIAPGEPCEADDTRIRVQRNQTRPRQAH